VTSRQQLDKIGDGDRLFDEHVSTLGQMRDLVTIDRAIAEGGVVEEMLDARRQRAKAELERFVRALVVNQAGR
jgi:hypothetical protein